MLFSIGDVLKGAPNQYRVIELLSDKGGYGILYKVRDSAGNIRAAKVRRELAEFENQYSQAQAKQEFEVAERAFQLECDLLASFDHPQIPKFFEKFEYNKRKISIIEFVDGQTLRQYMKDRKDAKNPIRKSEAVKIAIEVLKPLEHIHSFGATHRDLKPENIMRTRRGKWTLVDLGSATIFRPGQARRTAMPPLTQMYSSPQVIEGKTPSRPPDDIYSLAVVLYELITGNLPALQSSPEGGTINLDGDDIDTPKLVRGEITDPDLEKIIFGACKFQSEDRWTGPEMRKALEQLPGKTPTALDRQSVSLALPADTPKVLGQIIRITPNSFYPGDEKNFALQGVGFEKKQKKKKIKTDKGEKGKGRQKTTEVTTEFNVLLPSILCSGPGIIIEDIEFVSSKTLRGIILIPADYAFSIPADESEEKQDIVVENPESDEQIVCANALTIKRIPAGKIKCWNCGELMDKYIPEKPKTKRCPNRQCRRSQLRPVEFR